MCKFYYEITLCACGEAGRCLGALRTSQVSIGGTPYHVVSDAVHRSEICLRRRLKERGSRASRDCFQTAISSRMGTVQEFCPCTAEDRCRRIEEAVETPYGMRHAVNQTGLVTVVCKQRRFVMSSAAFAARECPNTSEGSRAGPEGDGFRYEPAEKMCQLCADFCGIPRGV
ncbi:hypothetical protein NHJ13051_001802 [Beauveria bassiana]